MLSESLLLLAILQPPITAQNHVTKPIVALEGQEKRVPHPPVGGVRCCAARWLITAALDSLI